MKELLIKLGACDPAIEWAGNKSWEEIYNTCHRGDWLLWLHYHTNNEDLQVRTLAKGHCANTVRHHMKDGRSLRAVDTAIAFGEGKATIEELNDAAYAAAYAAANSSASAAYDAYAAASAPRITNKTETADIVRKYIPIDLWNTQKMIDKLKKEKEVSNG